ncbi:multidrug resistance protein [Liquorilactobacillus sucicola DSM 21376 = JCM 15457]|nr:multidrug resistance protein [Liquorilactobacillus sucicola DSM 21376 = JCM 15457]
MPGKHLLHSEPLEYKLKAIQATMTGYHAAFWIAVGFSVVGFGLAFFLSDKSKMINKSLEDDEGGKA